MLKRIFHRCENHLDYIDESRFPEHGTTGRGKVWRNYRCSICGKMYTTSGAKLFRINHQFQSPIKMNIGGCNE